MLNCLAFIVLAFIDYVCCSAFFGDFCAHEYFSPQCLESEVILMENATYGRMELGKCLSMDPDDQSRYNPKYFGCASDVLNVLDERCSGLRTCNVHVTDPELLKRSNCYQGLMLYLNARYTCRNVIRPDKSCSMLVTSEPVYYAVGEGFPIESTNKVYRCGSKDNPLLVEATSGQTVNVSIIEFSSTTADAVGENYDIKTKSESYCKEFSNQKEHKLSNYIGTITDSEESTVKQTQQTTIICLTGRRQRDIFTSTSNKIKLNLEDNFKNRAMLVFRATGCYDLKPPQDAWMKREGNEITVGCYMNRHTWRLVCNGRNWVGVIGNCTQQSQEFQNDFVMSLDIISKSDEARPENVFTLAILLSILLLTGLIVCFICLFCYQKGKLNKKDLYRGNNFKLPEPCIDDITANGKSHFKTVYHDTKINSDGNIIQDPSDRCYYVLEDEDERKSLNDK